MNLSSEELSVVYRWPIGEWGEKVDKSIMLVCNSLLEKGIMELASKKQYEKLYAEYMGTLLGETGMDNEYGSTILDKDIGTLSPKDRKIKIEYSRLRGKGFYLGARLLRLYRYNKKFCGFPYDPVFIGLSRLGVKEYGELILKDKKFIEQENGRSGIRSRDGDEDNTFMDGSGFTW